MNITASRWLEADPFCSDAGTGQICMDCDKISNQARFSEKQAQ